MQKHLMKEAEKGSCDSAEKEKDWTAGPCLRRGKNCYNKLVKNMFDTSGSDGL